MDVLLERGFARNNRIFFCYAEPVTGGGRIAVARPAGRRRAHRPTDRAWSRSVSSSASSGPADRGANIGCRMVQGTDGNLFVTLGDHFARRAGAEARQRIGKIARITPDGKAPPGQSLRRQAGRAAGNLGLRPAQSGRLAFNPASGELWEQEHGPRGGDEINIIRKGGNYGWPVVSFGVNYDGTPVGTGKQHHAGMIDPVWHWTPSIAPSGMAFYTGDLFPRLEGQPVQRRAQIRAGLAPDARRRQGDQGGAHPARLGERIRDVRQGPDGALYLLTDNAAGRILRVTPAK